MDDHKPDIGDTVGSLGCGLGFAILVLAIAVGIAFQVLKGCAVIH